jgi:hypothetical protein
MKAPTCVEPRGHARAPRPVRIPLSPNTRGTPRNTPSTRAPSHPPGDHATADRSTGIWPAAPVTLEGDRPVALGVPTLGQNACHWEARGVHAVDARTFVALQVQAYPIASTVSTSTVGSSVRLSAHHSRPPSDRWLASRAGASPRSPRRASGCGVRLRPGHQQAAQAFDHGPDYEGGVPAALDHGVGVEGSHQCLPNRRVGHWQEGHRQFGV